jgi:hypothetical protein
MWSRVPCEQQLNMGQSVLSDRKHPFRILECSVNSYVRDADRKGIRLRFLNLSRGRTPHPKGVSAVTQASLETSATVPGRVISSLLGHVFPGIGLAGDRDVVSVKHCGSCGVRCAVVVP